MIDDEATEEGERGGGSGSRSDESIACRLVQARFITGSMFDVYLRHTAGESFRAIAETGPVNPFTAKRYHWTAIEEWFNKVAEQIELARSLEVPLERDPSVWGHWIAEGHIVRLAADNTPKRIHLDRTISPADVVPPSHFPDAQRLKASGKKPR